MGASQSIPSEAEAVHQQPRNKLTKPRTNSNTTREASCLPSLPLSLSHFSLSGNPRPSTAMQYQIIGAQSHGGIHYTIPQNDVRQPGIRASMGDYGSELSAYFDSSSPSSMSGVDSALPDVVSTVPVSTGMRRRDSMLMRSSTNSSAPLPIPNPMIPSAGTVRRRSQLLAAPPATATRKPLWSHEQNHSLSIDLVSPGPYPPEPLPDNDVDRCTTPSGYSVLGAFKRGSLRIANGAASPAPSSSRASPELSMKTECFGPSIAQRHEIRLVPPSPTDWRDANENILSGRPFSFMESPSTYNEDTPDSPLEFDTPADNTPESLRPPIYGPTHSLESLSSTASSNISIGYEYHRILTEQSLNRGSGKPARADAGISKIFTSVPCIESDEYHKILFSEAQKEHGRSLRQTSMTKVSGESTDSGYSSSGSIKSWKTAWSEQQAEPNQPEYPDVTVEYATVPPAEEVARISGEPISRRRSVAAAIRRRYSQGDLKAFARSNEGTKQPPIPTMPLMERKKSVWKPLPVLKHRKSMITVSKSPVPRTGLPEILTATQPTPPIPRLTKLERKGSFKLLTVEHHLPLTNDPPPLPTIGHATDTTDFSVTSTSRNTQDPVMSVGLGRSLDRGSKITGQDYYQRFSRW